MRIKMKLIVGASLLTLVPVLVVSAVLAWVAVRDGRDALANQAQNQLISVRDTSRQAIEDYFAFMTAQIQTFSSNKMVTDAMGNLPRAFQSYKDQIGGSGAQGKEKIAKIREHLRQFYISELGNEYARRNGGNKPDVSSWLNSLSDDTAAMQYDFISNNPNPIGQKDVLDKPQNGTLYGVLHKRYHLAFRDYMHKFGYYDIFLVDSNSGDIIYSVAKEIDFATSLKTGPYANTAIGEVFKAANAAEHADAVVISDYSSYPVSYQDQAAFVASPIFQRGKKVGVLIFQLALEKISKIMSHNEAWQDVGLGNTGQSYLVGKDMTMRSENRLLIESAEKFFSLVEQIGLSSEIIQKIKNKQKTTGIMPIKSPATGAAIAGQVGFKIFTDYRSIETLSAYAPVKINGLNWAIIAEIDKDEAFHAINELQASMIKHALVLSLVTVLLGGVLGWLYAYYMVKPIEETVAAIKDIAMGEGDLTRRLNEQGNDELAELASWMNRFMAKLQDLIKKLNGVTDSLNSSAGRLLTVSEDTNKGITEQVAKTELAATATNQMAASVQEVARSANAAAQSANQAQDQANDGMATVEKNVSSINELYETVAAAVEVINRLEQDSREIGSVLDVIRNIAEQTNLLALNAAIEAARAGEQGRGFAVVADEVRVLAMRTQESTQEIQAMIERLQNASGEAVKAMDKSDQQAKKGADFTHRTGQVLQLIHQAINKICEMNQQIANAAEQQAIVADELNSNVEVINSVCENSAEGTQQTAHSSMELSELAAQLKNLVSQFKV